MQGDIKCADIKNPESLRKSLKLQRHRGFGAVLLSSTGCWRGFFQMNLGLTFTEISCSTSLCGVPYRRAYALWIARAVRSELPRLQDDWEKAAR